MYSFECFFAFLTEREQGYKIALKMNFLTSRIHIDSESKTEQMSVRSSVRPSVR